MSETPQPTLSPEPPPRRGTPWDRRDELGIGAAFLDTFKQVLLGPSEFFRSVVPGQGIGGDLFFGVATGYAGLLVSALYGQLFHLLTAPLTGSMGTEELGPYSQLLQGWVWFGFQILLGPVLILMGILFMAALTHLGLVLLGRSEGFELTLKVFCYAQATAAFQLIPFVGGVLVLPYLVVIYVVGLAAVHEIGEGRAFGGLLLAFLVLCCCGAVMAGALVGFAGFAGLASALPQ